MTMRYEVRDANSHWLASCESRQQADELADAFGGVVVDVIDLTDSANVEPTP